MILLITKLTFNIIYTVSTKSKPNDFFATTIEVVHKFPSNLAGRFSNYCRTVNVKTIHFTWRVYTHYLVMLRETEL